MASPILTVWDTSSGKDVFRRLVRDVFDNTKRDALMESEKLYKMKTSDKLFERGMRMAGMPYGNYVVESGKVPLYDPKFGGTLDWYQNEYGMGFRVSWMMKKTNQWDLVKGWTTSLRMKLDETKDVELARLFNSPTASVSRGGREINVGYDTFVLGYAAHTCLDDTPSTYSNLGSADLSLAALTAGELYFDTLKDDQGAIFFVNTKGMVLYHHPALKVRITELNRSTGKPWEISNTMNFWEGRFEPYTYRRLSSTTAWGLAAVGDQRYDIKCFTLAEPDILTKDASDNSLDTIVLGHQAFSYGFGDPRLLYIGNV